MRYRNIKTGAILDSSCVLSGGDWVAEEPSKVIKNIEDKIFEEIVIKEATKEAIEETEETEETEVDPDGDFNGIAVAQIKQELDAFGIKYNPKAKKQELYDLMMQGR